MQYFLHRLTYLLLFSTLLFNTVQAQTPNFVVILVDDQGWTGTSVLMDANDPDSKSDYYHTPNLETMAANGLTFSQAYAPGAKCSPSRNAILTGKTTARSRFTATNDGSTNSGKKLIEASSNTAIQDGDTTIAEWLKGTSLNYLTAHYGKWHLKNDGPESNGFDYSTGNTDNDEGTALDGLTAQTDPKSMFALTDSAINFMTRANNAGKPFYVQISHYAVHSGIEATQDKLDVYASDALRPKGTKHDNEEYGAMTENVDSAVGLILAELTALGLTGTTYVIYTSDNGAVNGTSTNNPLQRGKTFIYEGGIRVPFIIQGPNITANTRSSEPIVGYDLFPTIAALSGGTIAQPTLIDGQDISGIWDGGGFTRSNSLYFHIPHYENNANKTPRSALVNGNHKLIVEYETGLNYLYDLSTDIGEDTDISGSNTALVEIMRKELRDHLEKVEANMPALDPTHADFSGTGDDVDNDGLDDAWEIKKALAYTYSPTDNVDGDAATFQEEHDYDSDPLTDEGLTATDASFNTNAIYILESYGDTTIRIAFPVYNSTGGDVTVNYTVSGTATSGVDFTALNGSVTIADGVNKQDITISLLDDLYDEAEETIVLTLTAGTGVTVGKNGTLTITIADNECAQSPLDPSLNTCNKDPYAQGFTPMYSEVTDAVADTRVITTNGIPNHDYRAPNIGEINASYTIDLTPTLSGYTYELIDNRVLGGFGQAINGVKIEPIAAEPFTNPNTGEQNWNWVQDFVSSPGDLGADCNYAHQQSNGEYHYHGDMIGLANVLLSGLGDGTTIPTAPVQIGWAADGFPIYYKYGYNDPMDNTSGIKEYTPNYALKSGSRNGDGITAPCGTYTGFYMQDYEYNAANGGDLDECNGITGVTPEFPGGTYYYVVTSAYPSIPRCLKGTPSTDYYGGDILPVELSTFTGQVQNGNDVLLQWTTLSEVNNKGFELQKTRDWENWETLDFIEGQGTSIVLTHYNYLDKNVAFGEVYYRLKQVDFDGISELSETIVVEIDAINVPFKIYPNPTTDDLNYFLESESEIESIQIFNTYGQLVRHQNDTNGIIHTADLSQGIYFLIVEFENGILFKEKVIKY